MRLQGPIALNVIRTLRGVADLYQSRGQWIARAWPRAPKQPNTPAQLRARQALTDYSAWSRRQPPCYRALWDVQRPPPTMSVRELRQRQGLTLAHKFTLPDLPDVNAVFPRPAGPPPFSSVHVMLGPHAGGDPLALTWRCRIPQPDDLHPLVLPDLSASLLPWYTTPGYCNRQGTFYPVIHYPLQKYQLPLYVVTGPGGLGFEVFPGYQFNTLELLACVNSDSPATFLMPPFV